MEKARDSPCRWTRLNAATIFRCMKRGLATACERTSVHYLRVSGYRYDPAERLEKLCRFAEAARKLRAGSARDEVGLPGLDFRRVAGVSGTSDDL